MIASIFFIAGSCLARDTSNEQATVNRNLIPTEFFGELLRSGPFFYSNSLPRMLLANQQFS
jgi:hypothetical protein